MDVKSLYPSVPRKEGLEACERALNERTSKKIDTKSAMKLLELTLDNNVFGFNGTEYVQVEGTAIGSRLGRNYACTYLSVWEEKLLSTAKVTPWAYFRYVDDIWGIFTGTEEQLNDFHAESNKIHNRIQTTLEYSRDYITFLDVEIKVCDKTLETNIYSKPTDKHLYVHKHSDHPHTVKSSIPYGLGIRAKRICSNEENYKKQRAKIITNLERRGYHKNEVDKALKKVDPIVRESLLKSNPKTNPIKERVPLVLTYSRLLPDIQKIVHNRFPILEKSERMKQVYREPPITSFKRDVNLRDMLVHSKHNKQFMKQTRGTCKCGKNCAICKHMEEGTTAEDLKGKVYVFNDHVDCKTTNLVYGMKCQRCSKLLYVGETGTTLYERFQNHLSAINSPSNSEPIPSHFNSNDHTVDDVRIIGIEKLKRVDILLRKQRESFWIKKLCTLYPNGLNQNLGIGVDKVM